MSAAASAIDRWTQSTVWYLFIPIMEKYGIKVTRQYVTRLIREICKELGVTRESLGIIASPRAQMYYNGGWTSVSFDSVNALASHGTDVVFIEKLDIVEVLSNYADKYGVALVNTIGHLTEYGKDLIEASKESGAHVAIFTDYDASGIKIASEVPEGIPRLGVDDEMLEYFGLSKEDKQIAVSCTAVSLDMPRRRTLFSINMYNENNKRNARSKVVIHFFFLLSFDY